MVGSEAQGADRTGGKKAAAGLPYLRLAGADARFVQRSRHDGRRRHRPAADPLVGRGDGLCGLSGSRDFFRARLVAAGPGRSAAHVQRTDRTVRLIALLAGLLTGVAQAQDWPTRPVRVVVAGAPGSSIDIPVRAIAERLKERLGQPLVVENRPAAGRSSTAETVAQIAPDGQTLLMAFNAPLPYGPFLDARLPYRPQKDLAPVLQIGGQPFGLAGPVARPLAGRG